jgi:hypothetical protein
MRRTMGALRQKHPRSAGAAGTSGPGAGDARAFLVERVLAWQHRHPLARRLHPQQVDSVGLVAVPFTVPFTVPGAAAPAAEAATAAPEPAAGSRLRDRALARAKGEAPASPDAGATASRRGWKRAFDEKLVDGLSAARLARFALRHGSASRPTAAGWPVREVALDARAAADGATVVLWLQTAELRAGTRLRRVFLAPDGTAVLGRRLVAPLRLGTTLAAGAAVLAAVAWVPQALQSRVDATIEAALRAPAVAASAAVVTSAAAGTASAEPAAIGTSAPVREPAAAAPALLSSSTPRTAATESATAPATAPTLAPATAMATPPVAAPETGPTAPLASASAAPTESLAAAPPASAAMAMQRLPRLQAGVQQSTRIAPVLDEAARAEARAAGDSARRLLAERRAAAGGGAAPANLPAADPASPAGALASAAPGAPAVPPSSLSPVSTSPPSPARAKPPPLPADPVWALSTRALRTRFESEQALIALRDVAARQGQAEAPLRFEVLPAGPDFRAVAWPYPDRRAAERMRAELLARGVAVEVVPF